jgi:hypothetical protein
VATASPVDTGTVCVTVTPMDAVTVPASLSTPSRGTGACGGVRIRSHKWKPEEDAKLTDAFNTLGTNWITIAMLVPGRSNVQCASRWYSHLDPVDPTTTRRGSIWTPEEDAKLIEAVRERGVSWLLVATLVPGRTSTLCRHRWTTVLDPTIDRETHVADTCADTVTTASPDDTAAAAPTDAVTVAASLPSTGACRRVRARSELWTREEDAKLFEAVEKCGRVWVRVTSLVPGRTNFQCSARWRRHLNHKAKRVGTWTPEDDAKLTDAVHKVGKDWVEVAALVPGRTNVQCSGRWRVKLDPKPTETEPRVSKWTLEEDTKLIEAVKELGNAWIPVAMRLPGRSETQCANRWSKYLGPAIYRTGAIAGT